MGNTAATAKPCQKLCEVCGVEPYTWSTLSVKCRCDACFHKSDAEVDEILLRRNTAKILLNLEETAEKIDVLKRYSELGAALDRDYISLVDRARFLQGRTKDTELKTMLTSYINMYEERENNLRIAIRVVNWNTWSR